MFEPLITVDPSVYRAVALTLYVIPAVRVFFLITNLLLLLSLPVISEALIPSGSITSHNHSTVEESPQLFDIAFITLLSD